VQQRIVWQLSVRTHPEHLPRLAVDGGVNHQRRLADVPQVDRPGPDEPLFDAVAIGREPLDQGG
jgi:hypothetical protein